MNLRDIVFDLDGTLIDSAPSILSSMQAAFDQAGIVPRLPLTGALIGPPLAQTLRALLPRGTSGQALPVLAENFKRHYDGAGYRQSRVYPGVPEMLQALRHLPLRLHIATNKRILPALRIIEHLRWDNFFCGVHALDSYAPALQDKTALLQRLRHEMGTAPAPPLYVGDRAEDAKAAQASGMPFLWASWGYGGAICLSPCRSLSRPMDMLQALQGPAQTAGSDWPPG